MAIRLEGRTTKSTRFTKYTKEASIEVNASVRDTIDKLRQQEGVCRVRFSDNNEMFFACSENGYISIQGRSFLSVVGKVLEENGKTVINIYSIRNTKGYLVYRFISLVISLLLFGLLFFISFKQGSRIKFNTALTAIALIISFIVFIFSLGSRVKPRDPDTEKMVLEITRRVEAIKRWDD